MMLERSYFGVWSSQVSDGSNCRRWQACIAVNIVAGARRQKYEPGFRVKTLKAEKMDVKSLYHTLELSTPLVYNDSKM